VCVCACAWSHLTKTLRIYVRCTRQSLTKADKLPWRTLCWTRSSFLWVLKQSVCCLVTGPCSNNVRFAERYTVKINWVWSRWCVQR